MIAGAMADISMLGIRNWGEPAMVAVKHIKRREEIPEGERFVLVTYGEALGTVRDGDGYVFTVPQTAMSELSFTAVAHSAREVAKREKMPFVYACK